MLIFVWIKGLFILKRLTQLICSFSHMLILRRTIKPLLKKPEEEAAKRESSPELAKISALVTRPPKQKTPSKKTEEGNLELNPALSSDSSFSTNITSVSPRAKRSLFKPPASPIYSYSSSPSPPLPQEQPAFYYVVSIFLKLSTKFQTRR